MAALDLVPPPLRDDIPGGLRIGLVGAGRIVHSGVMPAYRAAGIQPVAACDPDSTAAKAIRDTWGVQHVFDDYRSMIDAVDLDLLDVNIRWDVGLSPLRVEVVAEAARRGIHVIIAKPVAETWQQCQDIVGHARQGGITFGVDFNTRYAPAFYGCRALILDGALGPLIAAGINYHSGIGRQHTQRLRRRARRVHPCRGRAAVVVRRGARGGLRQLVTARGRRRLGAHRGVPVRRWR